MNYSTSNFLPNLLDNKSLQELSFHLKELSYDLRGQIEQIKTLSTFMPRSTSEYAYLRDKLVDISTEIEHDVRYHLVEALKLAERELAITSLANIWLQISCQELEVTDGNSILDSENIGSIWLLPYMKKIIL